MRSLESELEDAMTMVAEAAGDVEMQAMAEAEVTLLKDKNSGLKRNGLQLLLLPKDKDDSRNAILEVRAGTGGDEAAHCLGLIYLACISGFAAKNGWRFEVMEVSETGIGGYKEATATISGTDVFARLKFESGVHRVQRVPETEAGGRIHTSAATVAVLPEAEDVDIEIDESDLRIDVFQSLWPRGAIGEYN